MSTATGETRVAKVDSNSIVEPIPGLEPYEPAVEPTIAADDWVTVVRAEPPLAVMRQEPPVNARVALGVDAARHGACHHCRDRAHAICAAGVRSRPATAARPHAWSGRIYPALFRSRLRRAVPIRKFTNAGAAVAALLEQTNDVVEELKGAGPLREVLQSELALVRQRLASVEDAAGGDADAATKNAPQFRALVRELERIRRIANSAAASLSRTRPAGKLPATVYEAYNVLGVNPDVSEDVAKKIVDALRMSWHPDHGRDKSDRAERENRIRQINVAWELITAKRVAA